MKRYTTFLFIGIILLAAVLRLYRLDTIPPGVNRDEASVGVTAYSLMTTGRDEYGRQFPLSFESFGDWKLPLYIYTTIPFVKIFGLSEMAVRLPSALAGIATVAAIYYLANILFASEAISLLAAGVLALMPWHIHISRVESEANVAVLLIIIGTILFFSATKNKSLGRLVGSALLFAATYYTYHGNHIFTTLFVMGLLGLYRNDVVKVPRWQIAAVGGIVVTAVILSVTLLGADRTKLSGISIFGDPTVVHNQIELPRLAHDNPNSLVARIIHNRVTYAVITVFQNYLKSYGPDFLFLQGGGNRAHNIQGYGNLHPIEAPLLLLGICWLIANRKKKGSSLILWWVSIGALAAAITKDAPHSNRMFAVVPSFAIATGAGINWLITELSKPWKKIAIALLVCGYIFFVGVYLDRYFVHFPKTEAASWGYVYKKLTPILFSRENSRKDVVMTHPETSPYIYLLFYGGYNPKDYQKQARRYPISADGFTDVAGFGRFSFRAIDWNKDVARPNTLLVADADEVPSALVQKILATVTLPDNTPQFVVLDTDK